MTRWALLFFLGCCTALPISVEQQREATKYLETQATKQQSSVLAQMSVQLATASDSSVLTKLIHLFEQAAQKIQEQIGIEQGERDVCNGKIMNSDRDMAEQDDTMNDSQASMLKHQARVEDAQQHLKELKDTDEDELKAADEEFMVFTEETKELIIRINDEENLKIKIADALEEAKINHEEMVANGTRAGKDRAKGWLNTLQAFLDVVAEQVGVLTHDQKTLQSKYHKTHAMFERRMKDRKITEAAEEKRVVEYQERAVKDKKTFIAARRKFKGLQQERIHIDEMCAKTLDFEERLKQRQSEIVSLKTVHEILTNSNPEE